MKYSGLPCKCRVLSFAVLFKSVPVHTYPLPAFMYVKRATALLAAILDEHETSIWQLNPFAVVVSWSRVLAASSILEKKCEICGMAISTSLILTPAGISISIVASAPVVVGLQYVRAASVLSPASRF
jgi:hypothetical protein